MYLSMVPERFAQLQQAAHQLTSALSVNPSFMFGSLQLTSQPVPKSYTLTLYTLSSALS